jgi:hypothetical protein
MVASSPARKNITRRTREEMVPRSPFPNNAPAIQRRPKAIITMLMKSSTAGIYNPNGEPVKIAGSMSEMAIFCQLRVFTKRYGHAQVRLAATDSSAAAECRPYLRSALGIDPIRHSDASGVHSPV